MIRSKFDSREHGLYDTYGRESAKKIVERYGYTLEDNPDTYGIDFLLYKNGVHVGYADAEVRPNAWWDGDPIYPTIHAIKKKVETYSELDLPAWYFSISGCGKYMLMCKFKDMLSCPLIEVPNTREAYGESFYDVPVSMWKKLTIKENHE